MAGKTKFEMAIIAKVKDIRVQKGLSQYELSVLLGTSSSFIGQVETPHHSSKYNLNHLNKLAYELGCSPQEFIPKKPIVDSSWQED